MNWKNRLTNYNFWISIFSAVLLILQALKIEFDIAYVNEIFTAVLGLLVVIGIISDPTRTTIKSNTVDSVTKSNTDEQSNKTDDTVEKEKTEVVEKENSLPIIKENETDDNNNQNGIETVLNKAEFEEIINKISTDLDVKIKQLENFNKTMAEKNLEVQKDIVTVEQEITELKQEANNETKTETQGNVTPVVAETECSFLNIIN